MRFFGTVIFVRNGKRIIGVCLTKVNDDFRTNFVDSLYKKARGTENKILVFNSVLDLYNNDVYDEGAKAIYRFINFELLDVLVILYESFHDKEVVKNLIEAGQKRNIPVILVHGEADGCYCINRSYESAFESVVSHIIEDHGHRDVFFVGGLENEENTLRRLKSFKKIVEKNGIEFNEEKMVGYGDYWAIPTMNLIQNLHNSGRAMPTAFICANDSMAITVCDTLKGYGYRVPEDIAVTGFDGMKSTQFFNPALTTCSENLKGLAELVFDIMNGAVDGRMKPGSYDQEYVPSIRESCGCPDKNLVDYREQADYLFHCIDDMDAHEMHIYTWMDRVLECTDMTRLGAALSSYALPNSYVCIRSDLISTVSNIETNGFERPLPEDVIIFSSRNVDYTIGVKRNFSLSEMVPDLDDWLMDDTLCVMSSIYVRDEVCGYYAVKTSDISSSAHKINRVCKTMNIAFTTVVNRMRQSRMRTSIENAIYMDTVTGLMNLKGLERWFESFSSHAENRKKILAVSVYGLPKYRYIYENYGINDIENAVITVAETLQLANANNSVVARTGDDEFTIINYIDVGNDIGDVINSATSIFFSTMEKYNAESAKDYYLEVNCGCTVAWSGWDSTLVNYIKLASGEMYLNRLKSGSGPVLKEKTSSKDKYDTFNLLLRKNLFTYFYQPIVDARSGEIYAYEALMRTTGGIKLSPLEVLEIAADYNCLNELEKITMYNIISGFAEKFESFGGRKLFINTIPGCMLEEKDYNRLNEKYSAYFEYCVFEITEQESLSDDELHAMKGLKGSELAVDDFGTGHSNIVNLLRYAPEVVKIDRFLITDIHKDQNKQMFVSSTVEFAKINNIKVVAEGVETVEELQTVIRLGVDLIQGYYTAKPAPEPIGAIPDEIRNEIVMANSARVNAESI